MSIIPIPPQKQNHRQRHYDDGYIANDLEKSRRPQCGQPDGNDGQYILVNPTTLAFQNAQNAFEGEAERLGLENVDDVVAMVKEVRASRRTAQA